MKKSNTINSLLCSALVFSFVFKFVSSCQRNKDCSLIVTILDGTTSGPVVGASVHVAPSQSGPSGNLQIQDQTMTTDASGVAKFTFKLPAMLNADVTPPAPYTGCPAPNPKCTTLIKLEEGKSVSKSIKVY